MTTTSNNQLMPDRSRLQCVLDIRQLDARETEISPTLVATDYKGGKAVCAGFMGGQGSKAGGIAYSEEVSPTVKASPSGGNQVPDVVCLNDQGGSMMKIEKDATVGTLRANAHGNEPIVCVHGSQDPITNTDHANAVNRNNGLENCVCYENHAQDSRVKSLDGVCSQISAKAGTGGGNLPLVQNINTATVRRLTPVECERLMGFPDNHTRIPWGGKPEKDCPDSPRYKACGNSMCRNVMEWIGRRIEEIEKTEDEK